MAAGFGRWRLRRRYRKTKWTVLLRRYFDGWRATEDGVTLFRPQTVTVSRYRWRADNIPTPWGSTRQQTA